ncbi:MAG: hypothetical protein IPL30_00030 [Elusimicrobia bacterium]|nr:hypothetical protein [Elusimicrobiota bacterium]
MNQIVFVKTPEGPVKADDFIAALSPALKNAFATLVQQLSTELAIDAPRAYRHENGDWSVWLEDEKGDRHNFVLYISPLSSKKEPPAAPRERFVKFGLDVPLANARPGETEWVEAAEHIVKQFSGTVQAQLLAALRRAEKGLPAFDGSIEETSDGVILRALKDGAGRQQFQAELRLKHAPSGLDA